MSFQFNYKKAFRYSVGWGTGAEQHILCGKKTAIASMDNNSSSSLFMVDEGYGE